MKKKRNNAFLVLSIFYFAMTLIALSFQFYTYLKLNHAYAEIAEYSTNNDIEIEYLTYYRIREIDYNSISYEVYDNGEFNKIVFFWYGNEQAVLKTTENTIDFTAYHGFSRFIPKIFFREYRSVYLLDFLSEGILFFFSLLTLILYFISPKWFKKQEMKIRFLEVNPEILFEDQNNLKSINIHDEQSVFSENTRVSKRSDL